MGLYKIKSPNGKFLAKVPASDVQAAVLAMRAFIESGSSISGMYTDPGINQSFSEIADIPDDQLIVEELQPKPIPLCAYCGKENPSKGEGDHVVARTFFAEGHRTNDIVNIIVPACPECNTAFSKDEEYYAFLISSSIGCGDHPEAQALFRKGGPFHRAFMKGKGPAKSVIRNSKPIRVEHNGLVLPTGEIGIDYTRLSSLYDKIARGLFYYHTGNVFPGGFANYIAVLDSSSWESKFRDLVESSGLVLGNDVFRHSYAMMGESPELMLWLTSFYKGFNVAVLSVPERKPGHHLRPIPGAAIPGVENGTYELISINGSEAVIHRVQDTDGCAIIGHPGLQINKNHLYKFTIQQ